MAEITVAAGQVTTYSGDESELVLRIYCRKNFTTSELEAVVRGGLHSENWYKAVPCTVDENSVVQHEGFTIDSTRDGNPSNSYYTFALYTTAGDFVGRVYKKIIVPATPTTTTLGALAIYSNATALTVPNLYYTAISADAINTLLETLFSAITNATEAAFGLVKLNHAAASVGNPLVVSDNHPMWRAMRETVFLESYGHSQSGVNDALTAIGSTPTVLRISEAIAGTANKTFPSNVLCVLEGNAAITMAAATRWTFETPPVAPPREQPYFTGDGEVVVEGGNIIAEWWTGTQPGSDDLTHAFDQMQESLEASGGGTLNILSTGIFRTDNNLTASSARSSITIQGRGRGVDANKGTIIKPYTTGSPVYLIILDNGYRDIVIRDLTLSLGGMTEIDESRIILNRGVSPNSAFGLDLHNVTLHASTMGQILGETKDTAAAGAWESVGISWGNTEFVVPKNGTGWLGGSINTTYKVDNPRVFMGEGADFLVGGYGWFDCFTRDIRGPGSPAPVYEENRTITIEAANGSTAVTVTSGQLTKNDLGARLYKVGKIDAYIEAIGADGASCTISAVTTADMSGGEANISVQWGHLFNRIIAQASITSGDKTITLNGATPVGKRFTANDVGRRIDIPGKVYSWIVSVTDAFNAEVYHNATATATNAEMHVYQDGRAGSFYRVTGDHNNINCFGGCLEGLTWDIKNEVPTNEHPFLIMGGTVQIPSSIEAACHIQFKANKVRSGVINDVSGVTGNVSFDGCTLSRTTCINEDDGSTTITLDEFAPFGKRLGGSIVSSMVGCLESNVLSTKMFNRFLVPTEFIDADTNPLNVTPTLYAANAAVTPGGPHRPAFVFGRLNAVTGKFDHGYGLYRNYGEGGGVNSTYGGFAEMKSMSQVAPYIGMRFKDMPVLGQNFLKTATAADLTANQNNYAINGGNDPSGFVRWSADAARTVTGIAMNAGAGYPFDVQEHIDVIGGSFSITFAHDSGSSTAANRFYCPNDADFTAYPGDWLHRWYDKSASRWRIKCLSDLTATKRVATDINYNANATPADVAGMSFNVLAGAKYQIRLKVFSTNPTKALLMDLGGTAGATSFKGHWKAMAPAMGTLTGLRAADRGDDFGPSTGFDGIGNVEYELIADLHVSTAGTLTLRACQNASHASNTVLQAGSCMEIRRVG